jgi:hypothetical protein
VGGAAYFGSPIHRRRRLFQEIFDDVLCQVFVNIVVAGDFFYCLCPGVLIHVMVSAVTDKTAPAAVMILIILFRFKRLPGFPAVLRRLHSR